MYVRLFKGQFIGIYLAVIKNERKQTKTSRELLVSPRIPKIMSVQVKTRVYILKIISKMITFLIMANTLDSYYYFVTNGNIQNKFFVLKI